MGAFLVRGLRLLRSNPRLFLRRLTMLAQHPVRNSRALISIAHRRQAVEESYQSWLRSPPASVEFGPEAGELKTQDLGLNTPRLSILLPVHDVDRELLEAAIGSVVEQSYTNWELCVADDASTRPHIREVLEHAAASDSRIRVTYRARAGHISAASNAALEMASGEFVVLLDHDDVLHPSALAEVAHVIGEHPDVDFIYSDEDKIDTEGQRSDPFFKPAWSPALLTSCNYVTHLAALRRSLVLNVGGFRDETVGSQDHDLFLRASEEARQVAHIPRVLYSWRKAPGSTALATSAKPYAVTAARRALEDTVQRRGLEARVGGTHLNGIFFLHYRTGRARVSLIVVGEGTAWRSALKSRGLEVCEITSHMSPVAGRKSEPQDSSLKTQDSRAMGDYLVFIDAGSRPAGKESVMALVEQLAAPGTGIAAGMTVSRGTVLQAGITLSDSGQPEYAYAGLPALPHRNFYLNLKDLPHEVSAGWVGCCALRREVWEELGGWKPDLPRDLAMTDLCLRASRQGIATVYTPLARFERRTPLAPMTPTPGCDWPWRDVADPYWNPNLSPGSPDGLPFRHAERRVQVQPGESRCAADRADELTDC